VPRTYIKLAAAVVASGLAVAACSTMKLGSAAIVGNQRITTAQLSTEVSNYNAAYQRYHGTIQQQFDASQTAQQVLGWLVSFQVTDRMAQRYGITITPTQQNKALNEVMSEVSQQQPGATTGELAAAIGLAPDMVTSFARFEAIQNAVASRLDGGTAPASGSAAATALQSKFTASQCRAAASLGIQVNPQFGAFDYTLNDYGAYSVVPATPTLSKEASSSSSSAASGGQLSPHC
jgi:folylpolyglutamate synthase/dihydropteroate synthase